jgi:uncharacterized protein (DUF1501 family)
MAMSTLVYGRAARVVVVSCFGREKKRVGDATEHTRCSRELVVVGKKQM